MHSGARPPWLDSAANADATMQSCTVIGPTADDLQKHCMLLDFVTKLIVDCRKYAVWIWYIPGAVCGGCVDS